MFDVTPWVPYGALFGAAATGLSALVAARRYIVDSRDARQAQARLVHAELLGTTTSGAIAGPKGFSVKVINDSDRRISGVYVVYVEEKLAKALLKQRPFVLYGSLRLPGYDAPIDEITKNPLDKIKNKNQIVGFTGHGGVMIGPGVRFVEPGAEHLATWVGPETYFGSISCWAGFTDANGRLWEREAVYSSYDGLGRLRKGRGMLEATLRLKPERDWFYRRKLKHYVKVRWWLLRHWRESVSIIWLPPESETTEASSEPDDDEPTVGPE